MKIFSVYDPEGHITHPLDTKDAENARIEFPSTDAYANELLYFKDCVKYGRPADIMKPEKLEIVIRILNSFPYVEM